MESNIFSATGRRKASVARARITPGKGTFTVNNRPISEYLTRETLVNHAQQPLFAVEMHGDLDIVCSARGGGLSGQAGAIRLAISRALCLLNADLRSPLRKAGLLVRDARCVERKKYGQPKARKRFQYSKR
ncbi:MAG: 30S ribosomal protein S9 [bacterium]|nr:30S ribosomal protein S9 [bacterium]